MAAVRVEPLSLREKLCYAVGEFSGVMMYDIISLYANIFLLEVVKLTPLAATVVIFGSRVCDVLAYPLLIPVLNASKPNTWGKHKTCRRAKVREGVTPANGVTARRGLGTHWRKIPMSTMEAQQYQQRVMDGSLGPSRRLNPARMATGEEGDAVGIHPRTEDDVVDPNPDGIRNTDDGRPTTDGRENPGRINLRSTIRAATWNVRTLYKAGMLDNVAREMERCNISVLGVAETHWTGTGYFTTTGGELVVYSGGDIHRRGVAVLLSKVAARSMLAYKAVSDRLLYVRIMASPFNLSFVQVYAPTADAQDEDVEAFYDQLQQTLQDCPSQDMVLVAGDFNAKVGAGRDEKEVCGPFGLGTANERGERLVEFCQDNGLYITNTGFKHHARRRYTWQAPGGRYRNQIDYILINRRWSKCVTNSRSYPGLDCGSDHNAVIATLKLRIKRNSQRNRRNQLNLAALEIPAVREKYNIEVNNRRRVLKTQRNTTVNGDLHYRELDRQIQREARNDKAKWLEEQCADIEQGFQGNSTLRKSFSTIKKLRRGFQPRQRNIKAEDNRILTNLESILHRWKEYCEKLYSDNTEDGDNQSEIHSTPGDEGSLSASDTFPEILEAEVDEAIQRLPKNKAAGADDIPAELLKTGNPTTSKLLCKLGNKIVSTGQWPSDWVKSVFITIPKVPGTIDCSEHRTIALISHVSKVLLRILLRRMERVAEQEFAEEQMGFRKRVGTRDQIFNLRVLME
ncbi:Hypp2118 [Branchiostoma lanceolatum]|uniref:Hypp2118 protein n=1 Tax=Branchiostoma lanceolatum TaxID=7740 RepID=A0A8K0ERI7_BRALA|nr:Hypp2118 [Branchiostoma lanceolatum]